MNHFTFFLEKWVGFQTSHVCLIQPTLQQKNTPTKTEDICRPLENIQFPAMYSKRRWHRPNILVYFWTLYKPYLLVFGKPSILTSRWCSPVPAPKKFRLASAFVLRNKPFLYVSVFLFFFWRKNRPSGIRRGRLSVHEKDTPRFGAFAGHPFWRFPHHYDILWRLYPGIR